VSGTVVVGAQWGDEGKGKIIDFLAERADVVVRFQGGANAGHTVKVGAETYKFHLLPSGVLRPATLNVIGNGVVVDPDQLLTEVDGLRGRGMAVGNLRVSDRAHVVFPYHKILDGLEEEAKGELKAGTTRRGIGPAYEDKVGRLGIRVGDLLEPETLRGKLSIVLPMKQKIITALGGKETLVAADVERQALAWGSRLREFVADGSALLEERLRRGDRVLFEGAQGTHLCIDHGIYPYGTSSNCVAAAASTGTGVGPRHLTEVIGVVKAYTSRVGTGPFPAELSGAVADHLREKGQEYGTTTGRPRRVGWLDLVMVRYAARVNGLTGLAVTRLDVLGGMPELQVCTAYRQEGRTVRDFPSSMAVLEKCGPVLRSFTPWGDLTGDAWREAAGDGFKALPAALRDYVEFLSREAGVPLAILSVGAGREDTVDLRPSPPGAP
jgi:adenylosuccinate synthase